MPGTSSMAGPGSFKVIFCPVGTYSFKVGFRNAFCEVLAPFGCPLGVFWMIVDDFLMTFGDFLEVSGVWLDCTHSVAKTRFMRFGRPLVSACSSAFAGVDSRVCF